MVACLFFLFLKCKHLYHFWLWRLLNAMAPEDCVLPLQRSLEIFESVRILCSSVFLGLCIPYEYLKCSVERLPAWWWRQLMKLLCDTGVGLGQNFSWEAALQCRCSECVSVKCGKPTQFLAEVLLRGDITLFSHLCSDVNVATVELELWLLRTLFGWVCQDAFLVVRICVSESGLDLLLAMACLP